MIEVKTADLVGPALDWAVAKAEGIRQHTPEGLKHVYWYSGDRCIGTHWQPSTSWSQGGPLIEAYKLDLGAPMENQANGPWNANTEWGHPKGMAGPTPLVAACRAIVAAKLGDVVSVPAELMP
ncbi:phage protein NinX family protein [Pseudomonas chlororaphis]